MSRNVYGFIADVDELAERMAGTWEHEISPASSRFTSQHVAVHLGRLEDRLLEWIARQEAVVGCVAWLTNEKILRALNAKPLLQVVMQKEDWLRPDFDGSHPAKTNRALYTRPAGFLRSEVEDLSDVSHLSDPYLGAFRCFGSTAEGRRPVMHHKFLVGCSVDRTGKVVRECRSIARTEEQRGPGVKALALLPQSVWVGSFNMTKGAVRNMDSALVLDAGPAYCEWLDVLISSEPLDFDHAWCKPQWIVGS